MHSAIVVVVSALSLLLGSQSDMSPTEIIQEMFDDEKNSADAPPGNAAGLQPQLFPGIVMSDLDDETRAQCMAAMRGYYDYLIIGQTHRQRVFRWQFYSSIAIFFLVIGVVLVGMYFSWIHFHKDSSGTTKTTDSEQPRFVFEASLQGIKVSSPALGVIILAISLLFFYLYLVYVYPISEIA